MSFCSGLTCLTDGHVAACLSLRAAGYWGGGGGLQGHVGGQACGHSVSASHQLNSWPEDHAGHVWVAGQPRSTLSRAFCCWASPLPHYGLEWWPVRGSAGCDLGKLGLLLPYSLSKVGFAVVSPFRAEGLLRDS